MRAALFFAFGLGMGRLGFEMTGSLAGVAAMTVGVLLVLSGAAEAFRGGDRG